MTSYPRNISYNRPKFHFVYIDSFMNENIKDI